eukprot:TRINITY_DN27161_c0_g1_i1.p1 TRINITY_DN27161_c0_g1~~TRINITY_DN27161_c0_g1_i1.p1  ORF type:complete len:665 (+),score=136.72 TRINITY_DN27161_c0_g1_i1:38-1996(+)
MARNEFKKGAAVRAFYDMNDHPQGYRFVRLLEQGASCPGASPEEASQPAAPAGDLPTMGLSTGWVPATVAEDFDGSSEEGVLVKLHGRFEDPYRQEGQVNGLLWRVRPDLVRSSLPRRELSLVVVRWRDYYQPREGSRTYNILNEGLIRDVLEGFGSPKEAFGKEGSYEVFTIFVCTGEHLSMVPKAALAAGLKGRHRAGLYFLWPTQRLALLRQPGAPGALSSRSTGSVPAAALEELMTGLESLGIRTCWPNPWPLYRDLAGKRWAWSLEPELARELKVPPTVLVTRAALDEKGVAACAASALEELGRRRQETHGGEQLPKDGYRGVVKLTFAWMGESVLPFTGQAGLEKCLAKLLEGTAPGAECLVQERVEGVRCELRALCVRDRAKEAQDAATAPAYAIELMRLCMHPPRHQAFDNTFALASHLTMTKEEAVQQVFAGDQALAQATEDQVHALATRWLETWLRSHPGGPPHVTRLDFMVALPNSPAGQQADVWTVEVTECGGSLCGIEVPPRTTATLNECVADPDHPVDGLPKPLPAFEKKEGAVPSRRSILPERPDRRGGVNGSYSRGTSARPGSGKELQEKQPMSNAAVALATVLALFLAQARLAPSARRRAPKLTAAVLALGGLAAVMARRLFQSARKEQRPAIAG